MVAGLVAVWPGVLAAAGYRRPGDPQPQRSGRLDAHRATKPPDDPGLRHRRRVAGIPPAGKRARLALPDDRYLRGADRTAAPLGDLCTRDEPSFAVWGACALARPCH